MSRPAEWIQLTPDVQMPTMGLGIFQINDDVLPQCIHDALEAGYRLFDTAKYYQNEVSLGASLRSSGMNRSDYFVTTKLWTEDVMQHRTKDAVKEALDRFGFDYLDLMVIHWPVKGYEKAWEDLLEMRQAGLLRAVGVSNFLIGHLEALDKLGLERPCLDQIEFHPLHQQPRTLRYCQKRDIRVEAYGPFMQGEVLKHPKIAEIARRYDKTPAQIVLRWTLGHDVTPIPKSVHRNRIFENREAYNFDLLEEDIRILDGMDTGCGSLPNPYVLYEESFK